MDKRIYIACKKSKTSDCTYLVLVIDGVFVSFDRLTVEKVAMANGISNIELRELKSGEEVVL